MTAGIYALLHPQGKPIDDTDNLIAAFCLVNGCTRATDNGCHIERVDGLKNRQPLGGRSTA
jgi:predicted nucleic acid-binding protein